MNKYIVRFLCSFFEIFGAYISEVKILNNDVSGAIIYDDGEKQEFVWHYPNLSYVAESIPLLDVILKNNWIKGDQIIFPAQELIQKMESQITEKEDWSNIIHYICHVQIYMIDEGEETDYFSVHCFES
jgi:hypothetical protein